MDCEKVRVFVRLHILAAPLHLLHFICRAAVEFEFLSPRIFFSSAPTFISVSVYVHICSLANIPIHTQGNLHLSHTRRGHHSLPIYKCCMYMCFHKALTWPSTPKSATKSGQKKKKWKKKCNIHFSCWVRRFSHATKNQLRSLYCVNFSNISRNFAAPWSSFGWANKECPTSFAQLVLAGSKLLWRVFFGRSSTRIWVNSHTHTHS